MTLRLTRDHTHISLLSREIKIKKELWGHSGSLDSVFFVQFLSDWRKKPFFKTEFNATYFFFLFVIFNEINSKIIKQNMRKFFYMSKEVNSIIFDDDLKQKFRHSILYQSNKGTWSRVIKLRNFFREGGGTLLVKLFNQSIFPARNFILNIWVRERQ